MKIKFLPALFCKLKKISYLLQKLAKLAFFGWSTVFPPGGFVMIIFLLTIWWSFVLFRKNAQCCICHSQRDSRHHEGQSKLEANLMYFFAIRISPFCFFPNYRYADPPPQKWPSQHRRCVMSLKSDGHKIPYHIMHIAFGGHGRPKGAFWAPKNSIFFN